MTKILPLLGVGQAVDNDDIIAAQHGVQVSGDHAAYHAGTASDYDHV